VLTAAASLLLYREVIASPRFPSYVQAFAGFALGASPLAAFLAGWHWRGRSYPRRKVYLLMGHYAALTVSLLLPTEAVAGAFWVASPLVALGLLVRSRKPAAPGLCPTCEYDLRATPGRCPECGATAAVAAPVAAGLPGRPARPTGVMSV
jgi:hypothetical protein